MEINIRYLEINISKGNGHFLSRREGQILNFEKKKEIYVVCLSETKKISLIS